MITEHQKEVKLSRDLKIVSEIIFSYLGDRIIAIINYGSYGRNEGSFYKENDVILTYNDYDILIVTAESVPVETIDSIKKEALSSLSIKWVDISQITVDGLNRMKPTQFNFDLKYGSKVIYGDAEIFREIPNIESADLTLKEGETLFFTRLWTLLGSLNEGAFNEGVSGEDARFFRNQMAKAIYSVIDVLLIQDKAYHWSYKKRLEKILEMCYDNNDYLTLFQWAYHERMTPQDTTMKAEEVLQFYGKVHQLFFVEMFKVLTKFYGVSINSTADLSNFYKSSLKYKLYALKGYLLKKDNYTRLMALRLNQAYIAEYFGMDDSLKRKTEKVILDNFRIIDKDLSITKFNWDKLRLLIADLRMGN